MRVPAGCPIPPSFGGVGFVSDRDCFVRPACERRCPAFLEACSPSYRFHSSPSTALHSARVYETASTPCRFQLAPQTAARSARVYHPAWTPYFRLQLSPSTAAYSAPVHEQAWTAYFPFQFSSLTAAYPARFCQPACPSSVAQPHSKLDAETGPLRRRVAAAHTAPA